MFNEQYFVFIEFKIISLVSHYVFHVPTRKFDIEYVPPPIFLVDSAGLVALGWLPVGHSLLVLDSSI